MARIGIELGFSVLMLPRVLQSEDFYMLYFLRVSERISRNDIISQSRSAGSAEYLATASGTSTFLTLTLGVATAVRVIFLVPPGFFPVIF